MSLLTLTSATFKASALAGVVFTAFAFGEYAADAAQIGGVALPVTENLNGTSLNLKGCALREELWTNLYAVSVYLPQHISVAQAVGTREPKLVRIDVTYSGDVPDGLPSYWRAGLQ